MLAAAALLAIPLSGQVFLATYFTGNGESGALFAVSQDGFQWSPLKEPNPMVVAPTIGQSHIVRDPQILRGAKGSWHIVWTTDWHGRTIGATHSKDGITWGRSQLLEVMKGFEAENSWAPEAVWDPKRKEYMLYWSSTVKGAFDETLVKGDDYNHRFYTTSTKDWKSFTPTKVLWNPGFNCIDATIIPHKGKWLMFAKDERKVPIAKKHLFLAEAPTPQGPWKIVNENITGKGWVEGPTAVDLGDRVRVYFDRYTEGKWGAIESTDLKTWTDVSANLKMVPGMRHGTIIRVDRAFVEKLRTSLKGSE